jgi:N utilization substance protein B
MKVNNVILRFHVNRQMISRRNIRIKVMQTLYALDRMEGERPETLPQKMLQQSFQQSSSLFAYLVYLIREICLYAETDARQRSSKHLPSEADLSVNIKIAGNSILQSITQNTSFQAALKKYRFESIDSTELVRKCYSQLITHETYRDYVELDERIRKSEKQILETLFHEILLPNADFIAHMEELYVQWDDDAENMIAILSNCLQKADSFRFDNIIGREKSEYAFNLLKTVVEKKAHLLDIIKPKLKNWEAERVAQLDLILLCLGVAEFLYFETIPTKVTINEYIDLGKSYSTPQSGQFINGLLDTILKELKAENKIQKIVYKNSTL